MPKPQSLGLSGATIWSAIRFFENSALVKSVFLADAYMSNQVSSDRSCLSKRTGWAKELNRLSLRHALSSKASQSVPRCCQANPNLSPNPTLGWIENQV
jgi:hypothetical protein